jgi:hypothetical protein
MVMGTKAGVVMTMIVNTVPVPVSAVA